ncbi:hypothetical protein [Tautonia sociabilis]|uniref:Uncharacterized protein n=1 Tax=Tautonia sociabilis TaxID=2080755 RepID=A0A432MMC1_9BACT|nr:hypothetical protein [Tautonia sociabilis]RUL88571.1 hypothetical protein TsocGM_06520 [Tautonia sociabilis]
MSQARSSRTARSGAGRAARSGRSQAIPAQRGGRGVYVQQAKSDIFVVLLGVALGAMVLGCLFLVVKLNQYGFSTTVSG